MSSQSLRRVVVCCLGYCCCLYGGGISVVVGQDDPQAVLKDKGLKPVSGIAVLGDETKVSKMLGDVPKYRRELTEASKVVAAAERTVFEKDVVIQQCLQQRRLLNSQLANARTVEQNNKLVATINELSDRIELMSNSEQIEKNAKDLRAKANQLREKYVDHVLEIRKLHDKLLQDYEELANDSDVKAALEEVSKTTGKPVKLGPSRILLSAGPNIKKIADTVLLEKIALRGGDDKVWYVSVVVNGRPAQEFVLDTGASILSLPAKVAEDLGLEVSASSPTLRLQLADGRVIEANKRSPRPCAWENSRSKTWSAPCCRRRR